MLTVACVLRSGGPYDELWYSRHQPDARIAAYVRALSHGVGDHLEVDHRFVCLTDRPEWCRWPGSGVEPIELEHSWPGWWSKMELFRLPGPLLYLDLDTVIVGDLTPLAHTIENGLFGREQIDITSMDSSAQWKNENYVDGLGLDGLLMLRDFNSGFPQSGLLGWGHSMWPLYETFLDDACGATWIAGHVGPAMRANGVSWRGDGEWIRAHSKLAGHGIRLAQDVMPGIVSYKREVIGREAPPDGARLVCFHGHPRPHEVNPAPAWLRESWGALA